MQIVIDIPKIAYENTKRFGKLSTINDDELAKAIANGMPLPKRHGRLIDADELRKNWIFTRTEKIIIDDAPTILDAEVSE